MQENSVGNTDTILQLAANADGHIWADLAVRTNLGSGVYNNIPHKALTLRQVIGRPGSQRVQVQPQPCVENDVFSACEEICLQTHVLVQG